MQKRNTRKFWWPIFILYTLFIYATLGIASSMWKGFDGLLGGKGVILQYLIYSIVGVSILFYILFIKKERSIVKYLLFFLFIGIFFIMVKFEKYSAEKIHMAQYGLSGVLLYNALKIDFDRFDKRLYLVASIICLVTGAVDEVIQWLLPNRYFTWHDIVINGASGIITLLVIRYNILVR